jgi:hypothetical protein
LYADKVSQAMNLDLTPSTSSPAASSGTHDVCRPIVRVIQSAGRVSGSYGNASTTASSDLDSFRIARRQHRSRLRECAAAEASNDPAPMHGEVISVQIEQHLGG